MWVKVAGVILRNRLAVLIVIGILTLYMGYNSQKVEMSYEYAPLLPEDDQANIEYGKFLEEFGSEGDIIFLGVQDENFFKYDNFVHWQDFIDNLEQVYGVESVLSVFNSYNIVRRDTNRSFDFAPLFDEVNSQAALDSLSNTFKSLPFYRDLIYNDSTDVYIAAVNLTSDIIQKPERVNMVESLKEAAINYEEHTGNRVRFSGLPFIRVETSEMIKSELNMFIWLALGVTAIIIFLFFRSFKIVIFSMLIVGMAVIWALGTQALLGYKITILTGMIPPLIIVIGIPNSVFMLNKFHNEYRIHGNKVKALQRMIRKIGNATFLTNVTTASGFATFVFTSSRILIEFGIIAAINIMVVFVLSLFLIPVIFSYLNDPLPRHISHLDRNNVKGFIEQLLRLSLHHRVKVFSVTLFIFFVALFGISKMESTGYMVDDIPHDHDLYEDLVFFEEHFNGLMPLEVKISTGTPNAFLQPSAIREVNQFQLSLDSVKEVSRTISYVDFLKFSRQAYYNGLEQFYDIPGNHDRNFIFSFLRNNDFDGGYGIASAFADSSMSQIRINMRMADVGTSKMQEVEKELDSILNAVFDSEKYDTILTGASVIFFKGADYLVRNLLLSLFLAVILIASFMAWMFNSKRMVLVSLIPNILPLLTTAALMGYFGIPVKPSTILVFSIAFGISVDDTIHFLAKYRQELNETNWSIRAAVVLATKETGLSMFYTSIILFFGFGIFSLSQFGGTVALGLLVAFTLLIALFANLILLPSLLLFLERTITNQSFKEPLLTIYDEDEDIELQDLVIESEENREF
ncbi:MMPL family transporter [Marinilabiliaceae bacterium ANBcel2]|nr:MMPL family transporter [Marinilabiliaceae bacterium ANBcel2]